MNFVSVFMAVFSVLGGIDRIIGNKFGLGERFEKGFMLFGNMALSMIGMIVLAPLVADILKPVLGIVENVLHIDPSIIPSIVFANDMGGASLAVETASDARIGMYNALVVAAMMGATFSFSVPYALSAVKEERHHDMFLGFLCGIITIPIGCFVSGLILKLPIVALLIDLLPLVIFSVIISAGIALCPNACVKIFSIFGKIIKIIITIGLIIGVIQFLTGIELISGLDTLEEGARICINASVVMTGAFPFLHIVSKILEKPLLKLGKALKINENSALGFISTLATNVTTFEMMNDMDSKGTVLNSAFAVSAAFVFAGHLAFTMAFDESYLMPVIIGKLISGVSALVLSVFVYKRNGQAALSNKSDN